MVIKNTYIHRNISEIKMFRERTFTVDLFLPSLPLCSSPCLMYLIKQRNISPYPPISLHWKFEKHFTIVYRSTSRATYQGIYTTKNRFLSEMCLSLLGLLLLNTIGRLTYKQQKLMAHSSRSCEIEVQDTSMVAFW